MDVVEPADSIAKPRLRGWLHEIAFFASVPAGVVLVSLAHGVQARTAGVIYAVSLAGLFGSSAAYHRIEWSPPTRRWLKRLDHSMIFLLIAGTYTPFSLLVLHGAWSVAILAIVWTGAAAGIALKMAKIDGLHVVSGILYVGLGWLAVITFPQMFRELSGPAVALLLIGGVLYTLGAIVLAGRRPDPNPATFGYHELWHAMVVAASACHYAVILLVFRTVA